MTLKSRQIKFVISLVIVAASVAILFPIGNKTLIAIRTHSYPYPYEVPPTLVVADTKDLSAATAVPVLMYHGVVVGSTLGDNTTRDNFIAQMEMLKSEGYETITVAEYDAFRQGAFTLPKKPVIITFDDGRKDSFYTTDEIFKQLGFEATLFIATGKANTNDPFYLSWEELKEVHATGRWEIEAHGRHSHDEVVISESGERGQYLTSRQYIPGKGLETIADFEARVASDYEDGNNDLTEYLGVVPKYYAVPLNDYGFSENSNYTGGFAYNEGLTRNHYRLAFVQARTTPTGGALESFYNFADSNPHKLKRYEVKNITADELSSALRRFRLGTPSLSYTEGNDASALIAKAYLLYGTLTDTNGVVLTSTPVTPSARVIFGNQGWQNYRTEAAVERQKGKSVSLFSYLSDDENYIAVSCTGNTIKVNESIDGEIRTVGERTLPSVTDVCAARIDVVDGKITVFANNVFLAVDEPTSLTRGAPGLGVWDPQGASARLHTLTISPLP